MDTQIYTSHRHNLYTITAWLLPVWVTKSKQFCTTAGFICHQNKPCNVVYYAKISRFLNSITAARVFYQKQWITKQSFTAAHVMHLPIWLWYNKQTNRKTTSIRHQYCKLKSKTSSNSHGLLSPQIWIQNWAHSSSIPLQVGPLQSSYGVWGALLSSPSGFGHSQAAKCILVHFQMKSWHLVGGGINFNNFPEK